MLLPGKLLWARSPTDPTNKLRPAVVLAVDEDQIETVLIFGQTWDSVDETPAFTLRPNPNRGVVNHLTQFYASTMARIQIKDLAPSKDRLTKGEYKCVLEFWKQTDQGS